jgi:uncharacterized protein YcfL
MRNLFSVSAVIAVFALMLFATGCAEKDEYNIESTEQIVILEHSLSIHQFTGDHPSSTAVISGRAENTSDQPFSKVVLAAHFLTAEGVIVATESATRENIAPYETWNFTIQTKGPDAWKTERYDVFVDSTE